MALVHSYSVSAVGLRLEHNSTSFIKTKHAYLFLFLGGRQDRVGVSEMKQREKRLKRYGMDMKMECLLWCHVLACLSEQTGNIWAGGHI